MKNTQNFDYMMLGRLQADCEYFLGHGNRTVSRLWANTIQEHISEMKRLYHVLIVKPEWISLQDIEQYANQMLKNSN